MKGHRRKQGEVAGLYCKGAPAVTRAIDLLGDPDPAVRAATQHALTRMGTFLVVCPSVVAALDRTAGDPDPRIRQIAQEVRNARPVTFWQAFLEEGRPVRIPREADWSLPTRSDSDGFVELPRALVSALPDPGAVKLVAMISSRGTIRGIRVLESRNDVLAGACRSALRE